MTAAVGEIPQPRNWQGGIPGVRRLESRAIQGKSRILRRESREITRPTRVISGPKMRTNNQAAAR